MKKLVFIALAVLLSGPVLGDTGYVQMGDMGNLLEQNDYLHLASMPHQHGGTRGDHCMTLSKKAAALKGNPQRRFAAMQHYDMQCNN